MAIRYHTMRDDDGEISVRSTSIQHTKEAYDNGHPIADLYMKPSQEVPNFEPARYEPGGIGIHRDFAMYNRGRWQPTELFTHIPPQITGAFSDKRVRHTLPTMIGIAMEKLGSAKEVPMADSSLTNYSSALARNAVERGLAVPHYRNPEMSTGNEPEDEEGNPIFQQPNVDYMPERRSWGVAMHGWDPVSPGEVTSAKHWVRERLRATAKPKKEVPKQVMRGDSQFEQLNLGI